MADSEYLKFPYTNSKERLERYAFGDKLFKGEHFDAFNIRIDDETYGKNYARLRYVAANFAGLISKVCADMLFSEPLKYQVKDGDQAFIDNLVRENKLNTQNYESALGNSRHGDAVYKIRIGKRNSTDTKMTVIIEDITPSIFFPHINSDNIRQTPDAMELAWVVKIGDNDYLRREIHYAGSIENKLFLLKGDEVAAEADLSLLPDNPAPVVQTKIDRPLIVHIPNWKDGSSYFGNDDYSDITSLMFAINNRITKVDNILDKHSDPILAVPEGVLDEEGKVKKGSFHMFEVERGGEKGGITVPEYITWNANLESAFVEIDKLVEFLFLFSEMSGALFGMDKVKVESGRALKLLLLRTIAKVARKKLYYDPGIKEVLYTAQKLAKAWEVEVDGLKLTKEPVVPELIWEDGLPVDMRELLEEEQLKLDMGIQTVTDSIMKVEGVDEDTANKKAQEIKDENAIVLPTNTPKPAVPVDAAGAQARGQDKNIQV